MRLLRAIIAAFILLAMAVQPVLATMVPCYCSEQKQAACPMMPRPASAPHACCAGKHLAAQVTTAAPHYQTGCCCVQAEIVPLAASEKVVPPGLVVLSHGIIAEPFAVTLTGQATGRFEPNQLFTPTGPPLLALYCIWLK